jgi:uncharacterized protein YbbC (DUF1343 family)
LNHYYKTLIIHILPILIFMQTAECQEVVTGAAQLDKYTHLLSGKQLALVVNHTSVVGKTHIVDTLFKKGLCLAKIFAPEHGFRGAAEAGEKVRDGQDERTGTPIVSLYGKKNKPSRQDLEGIDIVVFDIQDVGARFYTYISTLFLVLEACAENGKPVLILDRPNPHGHYIDGPVLDTRFESFIGIAPLPIVHGCTIGELALLFCGENWIWQPRDRLRLSVVPCLNYHHRTPYDLPIPPSPNLPNNRAVLLYPSVCLFEGTTWSLGRGTDWPFQVIGHPEVTGASFAFTPRSVPASRKPPQEGKMCKGIDLQYFTMDSLRRQDQINLSLLLNAYRDFPDKENFFLPNKNRFFELLAGSNNLRKQIISQVPEAEIRATWAADLELFRVIRKKYLLYEE